MYKQYGSLPPRSIRVLSLLPGSVEAEIQGTFTRLYTLDAARAPAARVGANEKRGYEALSNVLYGDHQNRQVASSSMASLFPFEPIWWLLSRSFDLPPYREWNHR